MIHTRVDDSAQSDTRVDDSAQSDTRVDDSAQSDTRVDNSAQSDTRVNNHLSGSCDGTPDGAGSGNCTSSNEVTNEDASGVSLAEALDTVHFCEEATSKESSSNGEQESDSVAGQLKKGASVNDGPSEASSVGFSRQKSKYVLRKKVKPPDRWHSIKTKLGSSFPEGTG